MSAYQAKCRVCGEEWDTYHVRHDAPAWVAPLFFAGSGCETCEGVTPEGADKDAIALASDRQLVFDSTITDEDPLSLRDFIGTDVKPPPWKRPDDVKVWQCVDCVTAVWRNQDAREHTHSAYYARSENWRTDRELDIYDYDDFETREEAVEHVSHDGTHCKLCAKTCDDCGKLLVLSEGQPFPDPDDGYGRGTLCEDCYSQRCYDSAVESFSSYDMANAAFGYRRGHRLFNWMADRRFTYEECARLDIFETSGPDIHYTLLKDRAVKARVLRSLRRIYFAREVTP